MALAAGNLARSLKVLVLNTFSFCYDKIIISSYLSEYTIHTILEFKTLKTNFKQSILINKR